MEERRRHQRTRSLKGASIAFNNQSSAIDCVVKNLSDDGACLEVESSVGVPERLIWFSTRTTFKSHRA